MNILCTICARSGSKGVPNKNIKPLLGKPLIGYTPYLCESEQEAREKIDSLLPIKKWPCFFSSSDTTGEKEVEEFFTKEESLNLERFEDIGVVKNEHKVDRMVLKKFRDRMLELRSKKEINKVKIVELFEECLPGFVHNEKSKFLDDKM